MVLHAFILHTFFKEIPYHFEGVHVPPPHSPPILQSVLEMGLYKIEDHEYTIENDDLKNKVIHLSHNN